MNSSSLGTWAVQPVPRIARHSPVRATVEKAVAVTVTFVGGPWAGQTRRYSRNPRTIGCAVDARAKGMHGVYRTPRDTWQRFTDTALTAQWQDLPRD